METHTSNLDFFLMLRAEGKPTTCLKMYKGRTILIYNVTVHSILTLSKNNLSLQETNYRTLIVS